MSTRIIIGDMLNMLNTNAKGISKKIGDNTLLLKRDYATFAIPKNAKQELPLEMRSGTAE